MVEEEVVAGTSDGETPTNVEPDGADTGKPEGFYAASFKTKEATEAGFKEASQAISRLSTENDKLRKEQAQKQTELMDRIVSLQESQKQSQAGDSQPNAILESLKERLESGDNGAVVELFQDYAAGSKEYADSVAKSSIEPIAQLVQQNQELLNNLRLQSDPDYLARKETVDTIMGSGVGMAQAIAVAKSIQPTVQPAAPSAPGNTGGGKVSDKAAVTSALEASPEHQAFLKNTMKLTDEEIATAIANEKAQSALQRSA